MQSHITLRYNSKIKPFRWPKDTSPDDFLRLVANTFGIKSGQIVGFKNKNGNVYDLNYLLNNPQEAQKESYMLVVGEEKIRATSPKPKEEIPVSFQTSEKKAPEESMRLQTPLVVVSNFAEFEKSFLRNNDNNISIVFVIERREQLRDIGLQCGNLIKQYTGRFDFFCYLKRDSSDTAIELLVDSCPGIVMFCGTKKFLEIPFDFSEKSLCNVLNKLQAPSADSIVLSEIGDTPAAEDYFGLLENLNDISDKDYYFMKSCLLEQSPSATHILQKYSRTKDKDELYRDIFKLTSAGTSRLGSREGDRAIRDATPNDKRQRLERPETSGAKSRNKDITSAQEKFIQITAELERKGLLSEHSSSLIKSLILEENQEVINVISNYVRDGIDQQGLSSKLLRLADKLSPYIVRPTSPLPKKDEIIRIVNTLVRKRMKDENDFVLLSRLIHEGDELVYSTFEVFESDRDEEDLLDTLVRIVQKYKKMGKFQSSEKNIYTSSFYSSQKIPLVENEQELFKQRKESPKRETGDRNDRPQTAAGENGTRPKTRAKELEKKESEKKLVAEKKPSEKQEIPITVVTQEIDRYQVVEALKSLSKFKNLPADEYGIIVWLVKNEFNLILDVVRDAGGLGHLDKALPNLQFLGNKRLGNVIKEKFSESQRHLLAENKSKPESGIYAAYQCFKYDQDLPGLLNTLEDILQGCQPREATPRQATLSESESSEIHLPPDQFPGSEINSEILPRKTTDYIQPNTVEIDTRRKSKTVYEEPKKDVTPQKRVSNELKSPSKYTPLLTRSQRADSFKDSFQLKLISSDHPDIQTPIRDSLVRRESTPVNEEPSGMDVQISVIIPPKNEINQFTQTIIDKFYESQEDQKRSLENMMTLLSNFSWLSRDDRNKLEYLYENYYYELYEILFEYESNKDLKELEKRIREDILILDLENISLTSASPRERKRMIAYHSFKALLHHLKKDKHISERQYKLFHYLYTEEEVTILAAYEVYQLTKDLKDFLDTLFLIEQIQYFKNDTESLDRISHLNDTIEYQLRVIYSLKKFLNLENRITLEKIIRSGDETIMAIYKEYTKGKGGSRNKSQLIHKLITFAEEKAGIVRDYEKRLHDIRTAEDRISTRRRDVLESFFQRNLLPEIRFIDILYEMIEQDDALIHSVFEIFDFIKDKQDFVENLTLLYKYMYRMKAIKLIRDNKDDLGLTETMVDFINNLIICKDAHVLGTIEAFYYSGDAQEFLETVPFIITAKKKRRASNDLKVKTKL